jgi:hypothetical protein
MWPENGLESVSLVSFATPSGPDCAALGDNLPKYESATREMVGPGGVEPPTSRLSGVRSNHLSYEPILSGNIPGKTKRGHVSRAHQDKSQWLYCSFLIKA